VSVIVGFHAEAGGLQSSVRGDGPPPTEVTPITLGRNRFRDPEHARAWRFRLVEDNFAGSPHSPATGPRQAPRRVP